MDIKDTWPYGILTENETINATYHKFLKRLMDNSAAFENMQSVGPTTTPDLIAIPQLLPRLSKGIVGVGFKPLISSIEFREITGLSMP